MRTIMAELRAGQPPWRRDAPSTDSTKLGGGFTRFAPGRMEGACPAPGMTASCHPSRAVNRLARCMPLPAAVPPQAARALRHAHTSS